MNSLVTESTGTADIDNGKNVGGGQKLVYHIDKVKQTLKAMTLSALLRLCSMVTTDLPSEMLPTSD